MPQNRKNTKLKNIGEKVAGRLNEVDIFFEERRLADIWTSELRRIIKKIS